MNPSKCAVRVVSEFFIITCFERQVISVEDKRRVWSWKRVLRSWERNIVQQKREGLRRKGGVASEKGYGCQGKGVWTLKMQDERKEG